MEEKIIVDVLNQLPMDEQRIEIVERKGLGHPDTICDLIADEIERSLTKEYIKKFGLVLHHNIDKGLLVAGEAEHKFGGGKIKKPMVLIIGDRASYSFGGEIIPIKEIAIKVAKNWFKENLRFLDPDENVKYQVELKQASAALREIFKKKLIGSNDTSAAVGYYPLSKCERIVIDLEKFINSKKFKKEFPECGEDVKIMCIRNKDFIKLILAIAFVDRFVQSEEDYFRKKDEILEVAKDFVSNYTENFEIEINSLDEKGKGVAGIYLTVTGTCADTSDSGEVGRGNRVNGVIPLNRPISSEAAAGKNSVSHVGKIYNILSHKIAEEIFENVSGLKEVYVWLVSKIGNSLKKPELVATQIIGENDLKNFESEVKEIIQKELENIDKFCKELAKGKYKIC